MLDIYNYISNNIIDHIYECFLFNPIECSSPLRANEAFRIPDELIDPEITNSRQWLVLGKVLRPIAILTKFVLTVLVIAKGKLVILLLTMIKLMIVQRITRLII